ncbi:hypothetical protein HanRHA438_Chr04g0179251 [Helianthus annuus]|nr:hypothetical protein HanIR_Chr04g0183111 [Helianthus annuus]KAJ0757887.1 hypothetical protein HanLR1_Chr04g0143971 [Helianthus annuus]KAJ0927133.1 hypothetical protein HanRHA438_Chr04g0179251 [Helianthus annuus]
MEIEITASSSFQKTRRLLGFYYAVHPFLHLSPYRFVGDQISYLLLIVSYILFSQSLEFVALIESCVILVSFVCSSTDCYQLIVLNFCSLLILQAVRSKGFWGEIILILVNKSFLQVL